MVSVLALCGGIGRDAEAILKGLCGRCADQLEEEDAELELDEETATFPRGPSGQQSLHLDVNVESGGISFPSTRTFL